ncbi:MAG: VIT1/CCC1 transporter family protein [archaeon]
MGFLNKVIRNEIVRRYVVMNSFDGSLTLLGIVLASFFAGISDPGYIILPGVGAAIAMCVSGIWGAYAAEVAEVKHSMKDLEKHMLRKMGNTQIMRKKKMMAYAIAVVDGLSPLLVSLLILVPFFFVSSGAIAIRYAYYSSIGIVVLSLFVLGMFAGKTAKENIYKHGFKMLLAGIVVSVIFYLMTLIGLVPN